MVSPADDKVGIPPTGRRRPAWLRRWRLPVMLVAALVVMAVAQELTVLLDGTGVRCPPFDSYVEHLVRYVREVHEAKRKKLEEETFDPFD